MKAIKRIISMSLVALAMVAIAGCSDSDSDSGNDVQQETVPDVPRPESRGYTVEQSEILADLWSFDFKSLAAVSQNYSDVFKGNETGNFMYSPISLSIDLAMMANTVEDSAKNKILEVLECSDIDKLNTLFNTVIRNTSYQEYFKVRMPSSVWYSDELSATDEYKKLMYDVFCAEVCGVDFGSPATVGIINDWAAAKTNSLIPQVLSEINPNTLISFINVLYAKGKWDDEFDPANTENKTFNGTMKAVEVPMMHHESMDGTYYKDEEEGYEVVRLSFKEGNLMIIMPAEGVDITKFTFTPEDIKSFNRKLWAYSLDITMPKFELSYDGDLTRVLVKLGVPMSNVKTLLRDKPIPFFGANQKTYLKVDETGAEAKVVTNMSGYNGDSGVPSIKVTIDRPFLFVLSTSGVNIMAGRICNL